MREFNQKIIGMTRRACIRTFAAADKIAEAGGKMVGPQEWNRHGETIAVLQTAATELRAAIDVIDTAIEALDGESKKVAA